MDAASFEGMVRAEASVPCLLALELLEGIAGEVRSARVDASVAGIVLGQGCRIRRRVMVRGLHGFLGPRGTIFVAPQRDPAVERLVTLHQLAHQMLRLVRLPHSAGDAWALTLALAMPREAVRAAHTTTELAAIEGVPGWAAQLRAPGLAEHVEPAQAARDGVGRKSVQGY